ncbi:MAG: leucine-rich repeat domain-containing protein [Lachnospiraceae bacterium]|nr:leucine-rich repeat domain-containing protein [Lachnospiraceae bacterium]
MRKCRKFILAAVVLYLLLGVDSMICDARYIIPSKEQLLTYEINENGEAVITGGEPYDGKLVIPETIDGYHVVGIADRAFAYRQDIHDLTIDAGVRYIGAYAFAGCRKMNTPSLREGLQAIGEGAFRDNLFTGRITWKGDVFLPDSILSIDKEAFACCSKLAYIELPPYADIASDAFKDTPWQEARDEVFQIRGSSLEYINNNTDPVLIIPYGVTELASGDWMSGRPIMDEVSQETVYEEIIFPDTIVKLGDSCLGSVTIKRIEIPGGVKYIPFGILEYGEVSELVLSEGTETIGEGAFVGIGRLETIQIPDSVRVIEDQAFVECRDLRRITIPGTVEKMEGNAFTGCESLTEVIYEEGIQEIDVGSYEFTQIERIQFPESTVSICGYLSRTQSLERIYIPAGAVDLEDDIFAIRVKFKEAPITVYGQKGSRAEELAVQSGYKFVEVESGDEMP